MSRIHGTLILWDICLGKQLFPKMFRLVLLYPLSMFRLEQTRLDKTRLDQTRLDQTRQQKNTYQRNTQVKGAGKCRINRKCISKFRASKEIYQMKKKTIYTIKDSHDSRYHSSISIFCHSTICLQVHPVACQLNQSSPLFWTLSFSFLKWSP